MKRLLLLLLTAHYSLLTLFSQAPEKLTYQGVARNSNGETLNTTSIEIKFGIHAGSTTGELVWEETHATTTNEFGLFSLMIGDDGATQGSGSLSSFSEIDWATTQYFLNVQLKVDAGFEDMGTTEMLSVPYAMFAKYAASSGESTASYWIDGAGVVTTTVDVGVGTPSPAGKLDVMGDGDETEDDPLFQVKRKDGETVFAVYPGGVRINVDDSPLKGTKGGFAVGGFSPGKGLTNDYMYITPDSVRIYVDTTQTKGTKGGFAIGGFNPGKGTSSSLMHLTENNYFIGHQSGSLVTSGLYNSFFGYQSGYSNTSGNRNVFMGYQSGYSNTDGESNVFIGDSAGYANETGSNNVMLGTLTGIGNIEGYNNIFMGDSAGYSNSSGSQNVFLGVSSGRSNTTANDNVFLGVASGRENTEGEAGVFLGSFAGYQNTIGDYNIFIGGASGYSNKTGAHNVFLGTQAGFSNDTAGLNVFIGNAAGYNNTFGNGNLFMGTLSGFGNKTGNSNVFFGTAAGYSNDTADWNVFIGNMAGYSNTLGNANIFLGQESGHNNTTGVENVFLGTTAGYLCETGMKNVYIGSRSGISNTSGNYNIFIGNEAGALENGLSHALVIENSPIPATEALIYGDFFNDVLKFNANVGIGDGPYTDIALVVKGGATNSLRVIDDTGQTYGLYVGGTFGQAFAEGGWFMPAAKTSKNIKEIFQNPIDKLKLLSGVMFEYTSKDEPAEKITVSEQIGLVGEEVQNTFPELVSKDQDGNLAIDYARFSVVLIEAFKEQQQMIEEMRAEIEELKTKIK